MSHHTSPVAHTAAFVPIGSVVVHSAVTSYGGTASYHEFTPEQADEFASQLHTAAAQAKEARRLAGAKAAKNLNARFTR